MIKLVGIVVVAVGFAFRVNTLLVVLTAGILTGLVSGMTFNEVLAQFGAAFVENRYMTLPVVLMLPLVGTLEHHGLRERAETLIRRARAATAGRVLLLYSAARQISISLGVRIGDHASAVRPLVAPMAEAAAVNQIRRGTGVPPVIGSVMAGGTGVSPVMGRGTGVPPVMGSAMAGGTGVPPVVGSAIALGTGGSMAAPDCSTAPEIPSHVVHDIRAHAAAAENVGNFFGEDIFVAVGAVLLMNGFFQSVGMNVSMVALALWGIPTAVMAFLLMWWRVRALDRRIEAAGVATVASRQ